MSNPTGRQPEQKLLDPNFLPLFSLLPELSICHIHPEARAKRTPWCIPPMSSSWVDTRLKRRRECNSRGEQKVSCPLGNTSHEWAEWPFSEHKFLWKRKVKLLIASFLPNLFLLPYGRQSTNFPTLSLLHSGNFLPVINMQNMGDRHFPLHLQVDPRENTK